MQDRAILELDPKKQKQPLTETIGYENFPYAKFKQVLSCRIQNSLHTKYFRTCL